MTIHFYVEAIIPLPPGFTLVSDSVGIARFRVNTRDITPEKLAAISREVRAVLAEMEAHVLETGRK